MNDNLGYQLPSASADVYAKHALITLQKARVACPQALPVLARPDIVLTLSGVRSYSTYFDLADIGPGPLAKLKQLLRLHHVELFQAKVPGLFEDEHEWHMVHKPAFLRLRDDYKLLDHIAHINPKAVPSDMPELIVWSYAVESHLRTLMDDEVLPATWLNYAYTLHCLREGMLFGYPGTAITSFLNRAASGYEDSADRIDSNIAYANDEDKGAVYSYDSTSDTQQIQPHEDLWSDILTAVYESEWYRSVVS